MCVHAGAPINLSMCAHTGVPVYLSMHAHTDVPEYLELKGRRVVYSTIMWLPVHLGLILLKDNQSSPFDTPTSVIASVRQPT